MFVSFSISSKTAKIKIFVLCSGILNSALFRKKNGLIIKISSHGTISNTQLFVQNVLVVGKEEVKKDRKNRIKL